MSSTESRVILRREETICAEIGCRAQVFLHAPVGFLHALVLGLTAASGSLHGLREAGVVGSSR